MRLHSNENPFGPSPSARKAMQAAFDDGCRYLGEEYGVLEALIAEREGLSPDHVFLGAGSHEILRLAGTTCGLEGRAVVTGYPTFEGMERYATAVGADVHRVPLTDTFDLDLEAMDRHTDGRVGMVFVCNPNNPTGTILSAAPLRAFCEEVSRRAVVFVDEAYHEFVDHPEYASMVDLVRDGQNVVVSRTFSKIHGLAALRVGYGLARPDLARKLAAYRSSLSVNLLGLRAAGASYQDTAFQAESRRRNTAARQYVCEVLDELGYRYLPSQTNFVFFYLGEDVRDFGRAMTEQHGIRVGRPFPPMTDWCRLSVTTMPEMEAFAAALRTVYVDG